MPIINPIAENPAIVPVVASNVYINSLALQSVCLAYMRACLAQLWLVTGAKF